MIDVARDGAVGDGFWIVIGRAGAGNDKDAVGRLSGVAGERIVGVADGDAVDLDAVDVEVRLERPDGEGPEAAVVLYERRRFLDVEGGEDRAGRQGHLLCLGRFDAERRGAIVANFRREECRAERNQVRGVFLRIGFEVDVSLLGSGRQQRHEDENRMKDLHGCGPIISRRYNSCGEGENDP